MILPGATIGILGGGQLGRMLAVEARRMGYRVGVLDPTPGCPAAQAADFHLQAEVSDADSALELARHCDVVTLEWELVPAEVLARIAKDKPLHPSPAVLKNIQDRLAQREFLRLHGLPQTEYADGAALETAAARIGFPCVLKRRRHGYDGKGQLRLDGPADLPSAAGLLEQPCVLEARVDFAMELSVILARGQDGQTASYPVAENVHRGGILHTSLVPARIPPALAQKAVRLAEAAAEALGHVGVLGVEMFLTQDGRLLVNEIAPRVHNSGHFTLGACAASQFEQHLRAVCGLPLADPALLTPALMVNLMGELWEGGEPDWAALLSEPSARLHLYGKAKAAPGRKMGHLLLLGHEPERALALAETLLSGARRKAAA